MSEILDPVLERFEKVKKISVTDALYIALLRMPWHIC